MGTGGPSWQLLLSMVESVLLTLKIEHIIYLVKSYLAFWSSPRSISIGQLNALLHLHLRPIKHIVFV